jgi:hypothetical protein
MVRVARAMVMTTRRAMVTNGDSTGVTIKKFLAFEDG